MAASLLMASMPTRRRVKRWHWRAMVSTPKACSPVPKSRRASPGRAGDHHAQFNVTQLSYGGAVRNAIDAEASAGFDIRLTPGIAPQRARELVEAHVRREGYMLVDAPPTPEQRRANARLARLEFGDLGYASAASDLSNPAVRHIIEISRAASNGEVRIVPLIGGSLPIAPIGEVLQTPFVIVPIVNADNNQHSPNENIRMREFRRGIEFYAALLAEGGNGW
jgi:acetylornithine deacetylase/succinyl-diaminopimelate desuccinylase-like protein